MNLAMAARFKSDTGSAVMCMSSPVSGCKAAGEQAEHAKISASIPAPAVLAAGACVTLVPACLGKVVYDGKVQVVLLTGLECCPSQARYFY